MLIREYCIVLRVLTYRSRVSSEFSVQHLSEFLDVRRT